jgi:hypothetical protein
MEEYKYKLFSTTEHSKNYKKYRVLFQDYPEEIFQKIIELSPSNNLCLDVGCGKKNI